ncbi:MAG: hypothetical protein WKG07_48315 [Hymenobacter sp.]
MVEVENLVKTYGTQNAVDDISFQAGEGRNRGLPRPRTVRAKARP